MNEFIPYQNECIPIWNIFIHTENELVPYQNQLIPYGYEFIPNVNDFIVKRKLYAKFGFNHMSQKNQNEKSPILNGQIKYKTSGKVQKIRDLEGPTSIRPFENTRYIPYMGIHSF